MSQQPTPISTRQRFFENRQRRQNKIFTIIATTMAALLVLATLVASGLVSLPFEEKFSEAVHFAEVGTSPCPSDEALPSAPENVQVKVLNGTSRQGIAGEATNMLATAGFHMQEAGNADEYPGAVLIRATALSVDHAWTVARYFQGSRVVLADGSDPVVTVILGAFYDKSLSPEDAARITANREVLRGTDKCNPLDPETVEKLKEIREAQSGQLPQSAEGAGEAPADTPTEAPAETPAEQTVTEAPTESE